MTDTNRPLRVFLCHSSTDKPAVRELYQKLRDEKWIQPWLDEEELYPGQDWETEIEKAVESSDVVLVCISNGSINKRGFVQKELRFALDVALEMPEETIFVIPLRLEECTPPRSLRGWQYADYFEGQRERGYERLLVSLRRRADSFGLLVTEKQPPKKDKKSVVEILKSIKESGHPNASWIKETKIALSNGMEFVRVPAGRFLMGSEPDNQYADDNEKHQHFVDIPYDYWMARFPVTNEIFDVYVKTRKIKHPTDGWEKKKQHPVVRVSWNHAMVYGQWLNNLLKGELPLGLVLRLPTEAEWEKAARGTDGREYPWGNKFDKNNCNTEECGTHSTIPVGADSPHGDSPYACSDMAGNVWEWTHSIYRKYPYNAKDGREIIDDINLRANRGGSFHDTAKQVRCSSRRSYPPDSRHDDLGFRMCLAPSLSE